MRRIFLPRPLITLTAFLLFAQSVLAQKSANVLPHKIWRVRWVGVRTGSLTESLNEDGTSSHLMSALEKSLTAKDMAALNPEFNQLYSALNTFESGLGDSLLLADFYPSSEMIATKNTVAAEYGLTSKVSLGIIIPITHMNVKASFNADVQNNVSEIQAKVAGNNGLSDGLTTFSARMPNTESFANDVFVANGYSVPGDFSWTGLGDIELGAKVQLIKNSKFKATSLTGFRMPTTTHHPELSNLLDSSSGDGQWDLAFEIATEYMPINNVVFSAATRYTSQLPNSQKNALLKTGQSGLPNLTDSDTVQTVKRNLGDQLETEIGASYQMGRFIVNAAYENSIKNSDSYSVPEGFRSDNLEDGTDAVQNRYALGVKYTTVAAYVAKKSAIPYEAQITYNDIFSGRNVTRAAYTRLDLIFFF